jgi:hypothetical protein
MNITGTEELAKHSGAPVSRLTICEQLIEAPRLILERAPDVRILDLSGNSLTSLPDWFSKLSQLEVLFLSYNKFTAVPEIIGQLPALKMLGMRGNQIDSLPKEALAKSLIWLTLTDNFITKVPYELGLLPGLKKLLLAGNRLRELPNSFANSSSLELLRLSANRFEDFPGWLFNLPALAWLAIAGNPATRSDLSIHQELGISWSSLKLADQLGRGASGVTYKAVLNAPGKPAEDVAVKVFAANVSSDGASGDEIWAAIKAGRHPNLVSTRGFLQDHPEGLSGLVLDLVSSEYKNLAGPPSFKSCSRDVYEAGAEFSVKQIGRYAADIASAGFYLHQLGLAHGDLYAHNTLVSSKGALLSDFGAACDYSNLPKADRDNFERIEVRAFGILLSELLERAKIAASVSDNNFLARLRDLAARCIGREVLGRPSFERVVSEVVDGW